MKTWLKILRRSKTMIAAAALAAFGVLQQYQEQLAALLIDPTHRTLFIVGVASAGSAEKILDRGDPGVVVIDEIVGVLIALAAVPLHPAAALAGFALFRLFDIAKPFPVGWVDRHLHGGLGIMLDDVAAGLYALLVLHLGLWLLA